ncbi:MAG: ferric reductase-like transmembrane domain-containing protein [Acidimicrobiia bacterium]|nr:ferric reductase-like transmembrane domain-containing protein [Acidimicrobiia bacterium]
MRSHVWWYTARAGGIVAWALVSLAVVGGLQLSTRLVRKPAPSWVLDVHRFVGGLSVAFVAVHLLGLALDPFIGYGVADLFVPFVSTYEPLPVALGVIGFYLLLAIEITSLAMRKLPRRTWHAVHLTSFVLFVIATLHGLTAGTDRHNALFQWACLLVATLVLMMTLVRVWSPRRAARAPVVRIDRT